MQRKNNLLISRAPQKRSTRGRSRNGMAMIMAIAVIVIIATIMALSLTMTSQTTKRTNDLYLYEQAILISKSATEYALLRIADDGPCTHSTTNLLDYTQDGIYNVQTRIKYIYDNATNPCSAAQTYTTVTTPEQNGSILMDITVTVPDNINVSSEPIRYFRRTIQKL